MKDRIRQAEDRTLLCMVSIPKPELTYEYMAQTLSLLEELYLHEQMIPLLKTMAVFAELLLQNEGLVSLNKLRLARLLRNLGLEEEAQGEREAAGKFGISEDQRKTAFEKIKGLADPADDLNEGVRRSHF